MTHYQCSGCGSLYHLQNNTGKPDPLDTISLCCEHHVLTQSSRTGEGRLLVARCLNWTESKRRALDFHKRYSPRTERQRFVIHFAQAICGSVVVRFAH